MPKKAVIYDSAGSNTKRMAEIVSVIFAMPGTFRVRSIIEEKSLIISFYFDIRK